MYIETGNNIKKTILIQFNLLCRIKLHFTYYCNTIHFIVMESVGLRSVVNKQQVRQEIYSSLSILDRDDFQVSLKLMYPSRSSTPVFVSSRLGCASH